jgi:hypothetical protein
MANESQQPGRSGEDLTKKARELGRDLKTQASDFAGSAADTVKAQAENMTESARELASDATDRMRAAVADQKLAGADYVGNFAEIVRRASREFDGEMPQAGQYIRKAAQQINGVSDALRSRDLAALVGDVQHFARQQPAAFFGAAVLAGFAAVRFFKSAPESGSRSGGGAQGSYPSGGQGFGASSSEQSGRSPPKNPAAGSVAGM